MAGLVKEDQDGKEIFNDEMKKLNGRFNEMGIDISEQIYQATKSLLNMISSLLRKSSPAMKPLMIMKFRLKNGH